MLIFVVALFVWLIGVGESQLSTQHLPPSISYFLSLMGDKVPRLGTVLVALGYVAVDYLLPAEAERRQTTLLGYRCHGTGIVAMKALRIQRGETSRLFTPAKR